MFTDINQALAIAKGRIGIQDTTQDAELTAILTESRGTDATGQFHYRPYIAAAYLLIGYEAKSRQGLIRADGAEWLKPQDELLIIQSLLALQEASDTGKIIPPGWAVDSLKLYLLNKPSGVLGAMVI